MSGKVSHGRGGNLVRAAVSAGSLVHISKGIKNRVRPQHYNSVTQDLLGHKAEYLTGKMSKEPI